MESYSSRAQTTFSSRPAIDFRPGDLVGVISELGGEQQNNNSNTTKNILYKYNDISLSVNYGCHRRSSVLLHVRETTCNVMYICVYPFKGKFMLYFAFNLDRFKNVLCIIKSI